MISVVIADDQGLVRAGLRATDELATAPGGTVEAGLGPDGGFRVAANLPVRPS